MYFDLDHESSQGLQLIAVIALYFSIFPIYIMFHLTRIFRMGPDVIWLSFRSLCFSKLLTCFERFVDKYRHSVGAKFEMR